VSSTSVPFNEAERHDLLPVLIQAFYVLAPLQILMIRIGTTDLAAGTVLGAMIGLVGALLFASSRLGLQWRDDKATICMVLFLCIGAVSTVRTIYGLPAIQKGAINLSAMLSMVLLAVVVKQAFVQWPRLFPHAVRITAITTGVAGLTAIFQSFVSNVLALPELFDLSFLNTWADGLWLFSPTGGIVRAQGIFSEPSALATYIGMASGLAIARLGLIGSKYRNELRAVIPAWAAMSILASMVLSFSVVAYAALFFAYFGALASRMVLGPRSIVLLLVGSAAVLAILALVALQAGDVLRDRILGLAVFSQIGNADETGTIGRDANVSVRVLFLNAYVTLQNLTANPWLGAGVGAHPFAYDAVVPAMPLMSGNTTRINAEDASSLALRLLSETGILGSATFTAAVLLVWFRIRRLALEQHSGLSPQLQALGIALNASLAGVFAAKMLRGPSYYLPEFWALFALCAAIPALASMSASLSPQTRAVSRRTGPQMGPSAHS
jgi:hypothetical protein